ncbi:sensor histidine kinase (plasmid) [Azospirillum thermophilum]|uniref:histidine kinase n=2 Tax=Azospirillum thermophilum TaxID=2202148 RepID=A0A2S2CXS2_9PROT|nr:sensor histidine kinase [Azospirillum thermophilum]
MIGYDLMREHRALLATAKHETENLTLVLERHATDSFAGVAKILSGIAEVLAVRSDSQDRGDPEVLALLRRQLALSPLTRALLVVSPEGRLIHDSETDSPVDLDLSDRDYVMAHRDRPAPGVHLGIPVKGRTSGTWFISMSLRLTAPDGRFAGVVVAVVEPAAFRSFYETLALDHDAVVTLYHADGPVVARFPDHETFIGRSARHLPLFTALLKEAKAGTESLDAPGDGPRRIFSYRASSGVPLVVTVSLSRDAVLAPWRQKTETALLVGAGGSAMLALLTALLLREIGRRENMLASLQESERALRASQSRLIQDIAARHRAEAELIAAKQASDAANQAKTQFLANMSHELRTPLNAVIGFAEALESGIFGPMTGKQTEYVADIRRSGQHLLSLINDILDTTKIESGKYVLHEDLLDLSDIVAQCVRQVEPLAHEKGIALLSSLPRDLPPLFADERALRQILLNLLSNAVKFTPPGGRTEVAAAVTRAGMRLRVSDTGIGIAESDLDRVMEPFHQVDNSHTRRYPGTGLGLPLVRALVDLMGGAFTLTSRVGKGTTATILFPAERLRSIESVLTAAMSVG